MYVESEITISKNRIFRRRKPNPRRLRACCVSALCRRVYYSTGETTPNRSVFVHVSLVRLSRIGGDIIRVVRVRSVITNALRSTDHTREWRRKYRYNVSPFSQRLRWTPMTNDFQVFFFDSYVIRRRGKRIVSCRGWRIYAWKCISLYPFLKMYRRKNIG